MSLLNQELKIKNILFILNQIIKKVIKKYLMEIIDINSLEILLN